MENKNNKETNQMNKGIIGGIIIILTLIGLTMCATDCKAQQDFGILVFRHEIATGMSFANVVAAWGRPIRVDRSYSSTEITEYWWMNNNWIVVFENGRVSSFHQFQGGL